MAELNSTIIEKVWLSATNDFQQRIPDPTQGNIDATIAAIMDPMNKQYYNQFIDALVMRIGDTYVHQQTFRNPLAVFKKSRMRYGSTLQEIIPKWIRAHSYVDDAEDVFKMSRPDVGTWYHSQNRRDRYDITINRDELRTAFTEEGGLNRLVASILEVPMNSDEYDEYCIMKELIAFYENNWGFYKHNISDVNNEETAKEFLKAARAYAGKLQFPSCLYNSGKIEDIPVFVKPSELVLIITPEVQATIDVDALAVLFNVDKAEIKYRTILIDEFPIADAQALLTTEDFFMCKDTEYETTSAYNPKTLGTNYFLHHWGIYSVSPFVPAILFTASAATQTKEARLEIGDYYMAVDYGDGYSGLFVSEGNAAQLIPSLDGRIVVYDPVLDEDVEYTGDSLRVPEGGTWSIGNGTYMVSSNNYRAVPPEEYGLVIDSDNKIRATKHANYDAYPNLAEYTPVKFPVSYTFAYENPSGQSGHNITVNELVIVAGIPD